MTDGPGYGCAAARVGVPTFAAARERLRSGPWRLVVGRMPSMVAAGLAALVSRLILPLAAAGPAGLLDQGVGMGR